MEPAKRFRVPAFGNWDSFDDVPITECFESAIQADLIHEQYFREYVSGDLLLVPIPTPVKPSLRIKRRERRGFNEKKRQRKVYDAQCTPKNKGITRSNAVDEDLYKIPPEFLYQKPKLYYDYQAGCWICKGILTQNMDSVSD